jgi:hypothetical protein
LAECRWRRPAKLRLEFKAEPACCQYPAQVRACPDRLPGAGTARRPTTPDMVKLKNNYDDEF